MHAFVRRTLPRVAAALLIVGLVAPSAPAALVAYEPFNYSVQQPISGLSGGGSFGFAGAWAPGGFNASSSANFLAAAGSLPFPPLVNAGGHVETGAVGGIAGLTRPLSSPLGAPGTSAWLSFVIRPQGTNVGNDFFGLLFEQPGEPEVFMGKPGGGDLTHYVIESRGGGGGQIPTATSVALGQAAFLVVHADFTAGADTFTFFVNPTPGPVAPTTGGVVKSDANVGTVTGLTLYSNGAYGVDEIRLGDTFADVAPIPEPGAAAALFVVIAAVTANRRRTPSARSSV